jgi:acetylornithine deacetylase
MYSAEEEKQKNGLNSVLKGLPELECAIVGEPTLMQLATSRKGLLVLDVKSKEHLVMPRIKITTRFTKRFL